MQNLELEMLLVEGLLELVDTDSVHLCDEVWSEIFVIALRTLYGPLHGQSRGKW